MGGLTPKQIIANINVLTTKSQALQAPAQSINPMNGALLTVGLGPFPQVINGLNDIASTAVNDINNLQSSSISSDADAKAVGNAFKEFALVHQQLLQILIGKAGILDNTINIIGQPLVAALRQDESIIDTIAYTLVDLIKLKAASDDISGYQNTLNGSLSQAISIYSGLRN